MKESVRKIKVILKRAGVNKPEEIEIEDKLESYQKLVGGHIEVVRIGSKEVVVICDDEGKLKNKQANIRFLYQVGMYLTPTFDVFAGDILFVALSSAADRDFKSITDSNRKYIHRYIEEAIEKL